MLTRRIAGGGSSGTDRRGALCLWVLVWITVISVSSLHAHIVRIEITSVESPTFEGRTFGGVGQYEKLRGVAYGEVDPTDGRNAVITDIEFAPRNARGMVEYAMDIYILKPINLAQGSHKLFMEVNNRGRKRFSGLNNSPDTNDPTTAADAGEGFLMQRGYTLAWSGWDTSAAAGDDRLTITLPLARNGDGTSITGPSYEYISASDGATMTYRLAYAASTLDERQATLTLRQFLNDTPVSVPQGDWEYVDEQTIRLLPAGTPFRESYIYEFAYIAKDPLVAGLGLAATRDFVSFLRYASEDNFGTPNPLAGDVGHTFTWARSQPGRYLNDFQTLGFNEDESGRRVIDGIENWVAGGSGVAINYRFAQTARTERNRQNHFYPEGIFPFAYPVIDDPVSGRRGGRAERCLATNTCPKAFEVNSANEYWVKAGSLLHTDTEGNDLPDPDNVRFYLIAGMQHGGGAEGRGLCQQLRNPTDPGPALRALFVALDQWVSEGITPPESRVPRVRDATAVFSEPPSTTLTGRVPQSALGFPNIPGVTYTGLITTRYLFDFGPSFEDGIITKYPPTYMHTPTYPSFASKTDQDGNEIAGIRLPPVAAAVATTTGWALRREGFGLDDGCEGAGQSIPFRRTEAERREAGDPRLSLEERYGTHDGYVQAVREAARQLMSERLLLAEDMQRYVDEARESDVLK